MIDATGDGNGNGNGNGVRERRLRAAAAVLWPSFIAAALAEFVVFAAFDPAAFEMPGAGPVARPAAYTVGFFAFWVIGALSSALSLYLVRGVDSRESGS
jgi:hypothetical protein